MKSFALHCFCVAIIVLSGGLAASSAPPNVLFIVSDDLNCDLGCYGHDLVQSPHIDRLAERGLRFERAYCQYPVCNPSRSSFMTSRYPEQTGVLSNAGDFREQLPEATTLAQHFINNGYFVARVGKIFHYGVPTQIGTDGEDDVDSWQVRVNPRGEDREVHDRIHTLQPGQFGGTLSWLNLDTADDEQTDGIGATEAIRLLTEHNPEQTGKPFFLAVGFYRPHTPYVAPPGYFDLYPRGDIHPVLEIPGDRDDIPVAALADRPHQRELTVPQRKEIIQAYYATISYMDAQVGRLLDALDDLNLADDTIVVFTSDHGYHLGHHGLWQKGDLFEGSCRVPLIVAPPGLEQAGESTGSLAELVDLYPTLAELCDLPVPEEVNGSSLTPVLQDPDESVQDAAFSVAWSRASRLHPELKGTQILGHSIRTPRYRYTVWGDGEYGTELYDYMDDPQELTNLADNPAHSRTVARMQSLMTAARERAQ